MDTGQLIQDRAWIRDELDRCVAFWLNHGMDHRYGGVYTCLDRAGNIFSTDKSVWMQGRCAFVFSYLCNTYGKREEWLSAAKSCIDFLENHCVNPTAGGRLYFTVTKDGRPLRQRRYCFSEAFYAMANAEYALAAGDGDALKRARAYYELIYRLNHGLMADPTGFSPKTIPQTRAGRALADPMIYLNLSAVMRRCDAGNKSLYDERAKQSADEIVRYHLKPDIGCTLETVGLHGEILDEATAGRMVNPGHDIECAWFLLEEASYQQNGTLYAKGREMFDYAVQRGWDKEYGGLLYLLDYQGLPPEAYEHDMKLWWPQNELLIASLMLYRDTKRPEYLAWFEKALAYSRAVFSDAEYGEWYGYLRRDGKPTEPASKGSTFKGPFHLPRMLIMVDQMLGQIIRTQQAGENE